MIELAPSTAFMLYLAATLCFLLTTWMVHHWRTRQRKIITSSQKLFVCEYCQNAYLDDCTKPVTQCSQCKSYNRKG